MNPSLFPDRMLAGPAYGRPCACGYNGHIVLEASITHHFSHFLCLCILPTPSLTFPKLWRDHPYLAEVETEVLKISGLPRVTIEFNQTFKGWPLALVYP